MKTKSSKRINGNKEGKGTYFFKEEGNSQNSDICIYKSSQDHRRILVGRDFRKSLVQPSTPSKVLYEAWPGFSSTLSSWVLKTCKDGWCKTSLYNLLHCLAVLIVQKFLLISTLTLLVLSYVRFLSFCYALLWKAWLCLLNALLAGIVKLILGPPKSSLLQAEQLQFPQPLKFPSQNVKLIENINRHNQELMKTTKVTLCNGEMNNFCAKISVLIVITVCWPSKYNVSPRIVPKSAGPNSFHYLCWKVLVQILSIADLQRGLFLMERFLFIFSLWNWKATKIKHSSWKLTQSEKLMRRQRKPHSVLIVFSQGQVPTTTSESQQ